MSKIERRREAFRRAFDRWMTFEGRMFDNNSLLRDLLDRLFGGVMDGGVDAGLPGILTGTGGRPFNAYPASSSGALYPDFVGVCHKWTSLRKVLQEACKHEEAWMDPANSAIGRPTITIFTDKWDRNVFLEFENDFLYYSEHDGCRITVILVSDYGINTVLEL